MIKELHLTNWKSFEKSILYIDPLTIIIGTNASGKSNIVDALNFIRRFAMVDLHEAILGNSVLPPLRGGEDWLIRNGCDNFSLSIVCEVERKGKVYEILLEESFIINNRTKVEFKNDTFCLKDRDGKWLREDGVNEQFGRLFPDIVDYSFFADYIDFKNQIINKLNIITGDIFIFDPNPQKMRGYQSVSDKLQEDASNIAGVLAGMSDEEIDSLQTIITSYTKQLPEKDIIKVWAEKVGINKQDAILCCTEHWNGTEFTVDARSMSDGTLRFIAIVVAILTRPAGSLLVIEEIDNGLHPSRAQNLVEMLKELGQKRNIDIICTTHNPAMLDALGNKMIPFISVVSRDPQTGNSIISTLDTVEQLPKLIAQGSIGRIVSNGSLESSLRQK